MNSKLDRKSTDRVLKMDEIRNLYPEEWVLVADTRTDENFEVFEGILLAHSPERDKIYDAICEFEHIPSVAIEYTGPFPDDYKVIFNESEDI